MKRPEDKEEDGRKKPATTPQAQSQWGGGERVCVCGMRSLVYHRRGWVVVVAVFDLAFRALKGPKETKRSTLACDWRPTQAKCQVTPP